MKKKKALRWRNRTGVGFVTQVTQVPFRPPEVFLPFTSPTTIITNGEGWLSWSAFSTRHTPWDIESFALIIARSLGCVVNGICDKLNLHRTAEGSSFHCEVYNDFPPLVLNPRHHCGHLCVREQAFLLLERAFSCTSGEGKHRPCIVCSPWAGSVYPSAPSVYIACSTLTRYRIRLVLSFLLPVC